jgi:hypothetical protein
MMVLMMRMHYMHCFALAYAWWAELRTRFLESLGINPATVSMGLAREQQIAKTYCFIKALFNSGQTKKPNAQRHCNHES